MTTQPEALRLADAMSLSFPGNLGIDKAAAELRRQHEEIDQWRVAVTNAERERDIAGSQRDALLEKINGVLAAERSEGRGRGGFINTPPTREHQRRVAQAWQELHAAIKAVEENT